ncbi:hypothetical protein [Kribbella voronezhensis]|nr:hypothetical protein [Kribbella voronezhensis]
MVKQPELLGRFLAWSCSIAPFYIPSFSAFTLLELRRDADIYRKFIEQFSPLPCILLKSHEQLLQEEVRCYPDASRVEPCLTGFVGQLGSDGVQLGQALTIGFSTESILEQERHWNSVQDEIVDGISSLIPNFPAAGGAYTSSELRLFLQIAGLQQLGWRAHDFAQGMMLNETVVDIDAFPIFEGKSVYHFPQILCGFLTAGDSVRRIRHHYLLGYAVR